MCSAISPPSRYRGNMIYPGSVSNLTTIRSQDAWTNQANTLIGLQICADAMRAPGANIQDSRGSRWTMGITGYTLFNTIQTPNDSQYPYGGCRLYAGSPNPTNYSDSGFVYGTNSAHPGGVNSLFGDGSVKFVSASVSDLTWARATDPQDGGVLGNDW